METRVRCPASVRSAGPIPAAPRPLPHRPPNLPKNKFVLDAEHPLGQSEANGIAHGSLWFRPPKTSPGTKETTTDNVSNLTTLF